MQHTTGFGERPLTDEIVNVRTPLEESSDADLLREMGKASHLWHVTTRRMIVPIDAIGG